MSGQAAGIDELDAFLKSVQMRALRRAELATGNIDDAFDIVQDAMMKLATNYAGHDAAEWPRLFARILQNRINDWARRRTLRRALFLVGRHDDAEQVIGDTPGAAAAEPQQSSHTDSAMVRLDSALRNLPLRQQQVFLLRAWEGLDTAATADAMGIGQGSVKTHYSRALTRLRDELGEYWP